MLILFHINFICYMHTYIIIDVSMYTTNTLTHCQGEVSCAFKYVVSSHTLHCTLNLRMTFTHDASTLTVITLRASVQKCLSLQAHSHTLKIRSTPVYIKASLIICNAIGNQFISIPLKMMKAKYLRKESFCSREHAYTSVL